MQSTQIGLSELLVKEKDAQIESGWEGGDGSGKSWGRIGREYHKNTVHKILKE